MNNFYDEYFEALKSLMTPSTLQKGANFNGFGDPFTEEKKQHKIPLLEKNDYVPNAVQTFARSLGREVKHNLPLGLHPDFSHLKEVTGFEKHWIVTMFIDIKGSTNLFKKYSPEKVNNINSLVVKAAIHTCVACGGYIQRIHGDGVMVYFGGKNQSQKLVVENCLYSAAMFTNFVSERFVRLYDSLDVEPVKVRIGIDFGNDEEVLWTNSGLGASSEVTTCSLHTSLAAKMQQSAKANGIVVGKNISLIAEHLDKYFSPVHIRTEKDSDRYIFAKPGLSYSQLDFDWIKYINDNKNSPTSINAINPIQLLDRKESPQALLANLERLASSRKPWLP